MCAWRGVWFGPSVGRRSLVVKILNLSIQIRAVPGHEGVQRQGLRRVGEQRAQPPMHADARLVHAHHQVERPPRLSLHRLLRRPEARAARAHGPVQPAPRILVLGQGQHDRGRVEVSRLRVCRCWLRCRDGRFGS